jgi:hypothetical protein
MPKDMEEVYEMMGAMASAQRSFATSLNQMADDLDEALEKLGAGSDENKALSDGDVLEDREAVGPKPSDDVDKVVKVIRLNIGG